MTSDAKPRKSKGRRLLGCLIKGPLGCAAFAAGSLAMLVLFLPPTCGRYAQREVERAFDAHFQGSLDIDDAWFGSFYGEQRVRSLVLRDPDGLEILRADATAPSLRPLLTSDDDEGRAGASTRRPWGPIDVRVRNLNVVFDREGVTNVARAFQPRERAPDVQVVVSDRGVAVDLDDGPNEPESSLQFSASVFPVQLTVERWTVARSFARERALVLTDFEGAGAFDDTSRRGRLGLHLGGKGDVQGTPRGIFRCTVDLADLELAEGRGPYQLSFELRDLPSELLERVAGAALAPALGAHTRHLILRATRAERGPVALELSLQSDAVALDGRLVLDPLQKVVTPADGAPLELVVAPGSFWTDALVRALLPCVESVQPPAADAQPRLVVRDFALPLSGAPERTAATLTWPLGMRYTLARAWGDGAESASGAIDALTLRIEGGVVHYDGVALPLENGRLVLAGTSGLADGSLSITATHEREGEPPRTRRWSGTRAAPVAAEERAPEAER